MRLAPPPLRLVHSVTASPRHVTSSEETDALVAVGNTVLASVIKGLRESGYIHPEDPASRSAQVVAIVASHVADLTNHLLVAVGGRP